MEINKQETIEEAAERIFTPSYIYYKVRRQGFIEGAKYLKERMYSEEEVYNLLYELLPDKQELNEWFKDKRK